MSASAQLAGLLLVFGALPGIATLGLTLLMNRAFLGADMDLSAFATLALIIIATQALPLGQGSVRVQASPLGRWLPLFQRIYLPVYIGIMSATFSKVFVALWWIRWGLVAAGVGLCFSGYFILVNQLRTGIRPASNEKLFSAG